MNQEKTEGRREKGHGGTRKREGMEGEDEMTKPWDMPMEKSHGHGHGKHEGGKGENSSSRKQKPPFRLAKDDTKPILRDPILRSDPIETEEAVLRLPPFPLARPRQESR